MIHLSMKSRYVINENCKISQPEEHYCRMKGTDRYPSEKVLWYLCNAEIGSTCTDVNKARKNLFAKKSSVQRIPPTRAALEQHVKRAVFQGGHIWGQTLIPQPVLPSPSSWGWIKTNDKLYEPHWTTLPEASKTCYELVSCGCKKGCRSRCKCKKAALKCTALCVCEGECSTN